MSIQSRPEWQPGRYVSFLGDPVNAECKVPHFPFNIVNRTDLRILGIVGALGGVVAAIWKPELAGIAVADAALMGVGGSFAVAYAEGEILKNHFGMAADRRCIDTRPDKNTIPVIPAAATPVGRTIKSFKFQLNFFGPLALACTVAAFATGMEFWAIPMSVFTGCALRMYHGMRRFQKVRAGRYAIVEWPRPRPVEETQFSPQASG